MLSALALSNPPPPGKELDLFQLVLNSGGVVLFVLFLLIVVRDDVRHWLQGLSARPRHA